MLSAGSLLWAPPTDLRPAENDYFSDVTVQADGKIVAVGTSQRPGGDDDFLVARYTADGRLDAGFLGTGWGVFDFGSGRNDGASSVVIQSDGKIVVGGATDFDFGLIRLNGDGSLDTAFGTSGRIVTDLGASDSVRSIALTLAGRIVAVGQSEDIGASTFDGAVVRYLSNGTLDDSFSGDGKLLVATNLVSVAVDSTDRILIADSSGTVSRLASNGGFDGTFGVGGSKTITFDVGANVRLTDLTIDAAGRIVVVGYSVEGMFDVGGVARLLSANGDYDNTFNSDGRISVDVAEDASDTFLDVVALSNGALVVSGLTAGASQYSHLVALTPGGLLDPVFSDDGKQFFMTTGNSYPAGLAVTKSGNYVIAGRLFPAGGDVEPMIAAFAGRYPLRDDLAGMTNAGQWWVAASTGASFQNSLYGSWDASLNWKFIASADFNGDGKADTAGRDSTGRWWVSLNTGNAFTPAAHWSSWNEAANWRDEHFADFNGDGKADVAGRTAGGQWWVMLSTGTGFAPPGIWAGWSATAGWRDVMVADFTGDGRADIAGRISNGSWWVSTSTATGPSTQRWGAWDETKGWQDVRTGDFNGDGVADIAGRNSSGQWWVGLSTRAGFTLTVWTSWNPAAGWRDIVVGDFNGDGRDDIAARTSTGQWWVAQSNGTGFTNTAWGKWDESAGWRDVRVGDFDGDGKSDIAARTSAGQWTVARSSGTGFTSEIWSSWKEVAGWRTLRDEFALTLT
ncbi:MAG: FG-GAP-like repeat-containing protein [Planctomycetota bacterium]|nr:FG-GAP-like repeat-containing protein [Planctomycetota bacterium]